MSSRYVLILLLIASSVFWGVSISPTHSAIISACNSDASSPAGVIFSCPQGHGESLAEKGLAITVIVRDSVNQPVPNIPTSDIWVVGCDIQNGWLLFCGEGGLLFASAPTDANGQTTLTGSFAAGGCDPTGLRVSVQGVIVGGGLCDEPCLPIKARNPDLNGSMDVNLIDFATFGAGYPSPPNPYNECIDFVAPLGSVTLADFAKFGAHLNHSC